MDAEYIAHSIYAQIQVNDSLFAWTVGIHDVKTIPEGGSSNGYILGGLEFKMNGAKFRGYVRVSLMSTYSYTVEIGDYDGDIFRAKETREKVFCDELMSVIDRLIDRD